jgi:hypothetical protein
MGLNAVVLDYIDMVKAGEVLEETLDELTKMAGDAPTTEENVIRHHDEDFALIIISKHGSLNRKFLVASKAVALVHKHAFLKNHARLPQKAQTIAAGNIKAACIRYRLPVGEKLKKLAERKKHNPGNIYIMTAEDDFKTRIKSASKGKKGKYAITKDLNGDLFEIIPINTEHELKEAIPYQPGKPRHTIAYIHYTDGKKSRTLQK